MLSADGFRTSPSASRGYTRQAERGLPDGGPSARTRPAVTPKMSSCAERPNTNRRSGKCDLETPTIRAPQLCCLGLTNASGNLWEGIRDYSFCADTILACIFVSKQTALFGLGWISHKSILGANSSNPPRRFTSASLRSRPQHWRQCGRRAALYPADNLEAVAFVQGNVARVRAFEVGGGALLVAAS